MANLIDIFNAGGVKPTEVVGGKGFYTKEEEIYEGNKLQKKFISNVDYSDPTNFARFGSAEEYYKSAIGYINSEYPYDGGATEKLKWVNSLNELEYYIFKSEYPRHTGSIELSGTQRIDVYAYNKDLSGDAKTIYNEGDKYRYDTYIDFNDGITFESWIKISDISVPVDVLTINAFSESNPGVYSPVQVLNISSSDGYFAVSAGTSSYVLSQSIPEDEWHHYAFRINSGSIELFVDGERVSSQAATINATASRHVFTPFGLFILKLRRNEIPPSSYENTPAFILGNRVNRPENIGAIAFDDTRFWNGFRSIEKIGRFWFTTIDGNDKLAATDPDPQEPNTIFYFKYNEGWNTDKSNIVLDYSGRKNNGTVQNPALYSYRSSVSAFDASGIVQDIEVGDPIVQGVSLETNNWADTLNAYYTNKLESGREHDALNAHQLYNKFPSWVLESEENNEIKHFKQIIQILAVYFDDLYNKIGELSQYKHEKLEADSDKVYPFYDKILTSTGFDVTDLFTNLSIVERASSRDDLNLFDDSLEKVKNKIYQNIYSNLSYILKSKGTEKSIKSLLRTYGVGDNLVKVNLYGDKQAYNVGDRTEERVIKKKTLDLGMDNSTLYLSGASIPAETSTNSSFTCEAQFIMPKKAEMLPTASLFGLHSTNFAHQVAVTLETNVTGSRFVLVSGSDRIVGPLVPDFYDNNIWNIAVRMEPHEPTIYANTIHSYSLDIIAYSFDTDSSYRSFSGSVVLPAASSQAFLMGSKYLYVGADRQNLDGNPVVDTNIKALDVGYWRTYLQNDVIAIHAKDITNYGTNDATENIESIESRVLHWDFEGISGSDGSGGFVAGDLFNNYSGTGVGFAPNSTSFIRKEDLKTYKSLNFDTLQGIETIQTLDEDDQTTRNLRKKPSGLQLLVENSMYQVISEDMINIFASAGEYLFSFAEGANRYSDHYAKLDAIREKYFSKIVSTPDLEKYLNFYKWLDSALGTMIDQLKPESAGSTKGLKNTIESHMLERNKFEHKLPLTTRVNAGNTYGNAIDSIGPIVKISSTIKPNDVIYDIKKFYKIDSISWVANPLYVYINIKLSDNPSLNPDDFFDDMNLYLSADIGNNNEVPVLSSGYKKVKFCSKDFPGYVVLIMSPENSEATAAGPYTPANMIIATIKKGSYTGQFNAQLKSIATGQITLIENKKDVNYLKNYEIVGGAGKAINHRNGKSGKSIFRTNFSSGDGLSELNRLADTQYEMSIYNSLLNKSADDRAVLDYSSSLSNDTQGDLDTFEDNNFVQRNVPYTASNYTNVDNIPYEAFPQSNILAFRNSNIISAAGLVFREPPVEFNEPVDHNIRVAGAFENIQVLSPYGSKIYKFANSEIVSYVTGAEPVSNEQTFYAKADSLPTSSLQINRSEHLEYVFPKRKLMGLKESRTKALYPEVSGTLTGTEWSVDSYNRPSSAIRSFWRDDGANRRRTRGADHPSLTGSINCLNSYNLSSSISAVIVDKTGSLAAQKYNLSGSYYVNLHISGVSNRYDSIYSMDASGSIIFSGSN